MITEPAPLNLDDRALPPGSVLRPREAAGTPAPKEVASAYAHSGLVLLRGFALDKAAFTALTSAVTPSFMDYRGGSYARDKIDGDETILSVTGAKQFFGVPFHGEMFYTQERPAVLWFYCMQAPRAGGETTVCDGCAVYDALTPPTRALFETRPLKYLRRYADGVWQSIFATDEPAQVATFLAPRQTRFEYHPADRSVSTEYTTSAIATTHAGRKAFINNILPVLAQEQQGLAQSRVRFADGAPIHAGAVTEVEAITARLELAVQWQPRDLLMIDNSRYMHGRRAFDDPRREIYVRMAGAPPAP